MSTDDILICHRFIENQDINMPIKVEVEEEKKAGSPMIGLTGQNLPSNSWHNCRRLIYVPRSAQKGYSVGHWPIPEAFWPDSTNSTLVSRSLHTGFFFFYAPVLKDHGHIVFGLTINLSFCIGIV
jgi:hypothetical protein